MNNRIGAGNCRMPLHNNACRCPPDIFFVMINNPCFFGGLIMDRFFAVMDAIKRNIKRQGYDSLNLTRIR